MPSIASYRQKKRITEDTARALQWVYLEAIKRGYDKYAAMALAVQALSRLHNGGVYSFVDQIRLICWKRACVGKATCKDYHHLMEIAPEADYHTRLTAKVEKWLKKRLANHLMCPSKVCGKRILPLWWGKRGQGIIPTENWATNCSKCWDENHKEQQSENL